MSWFSIPSLFLDLSAKNGLNTTFSTTARSAYKQVRGHWSPDAWCSRLPLPWKSLWQELQHVCVTIEKIIVVVYTPLQIRPSSSSSPNEFPLTVSLLLGAAIFVREKPPSHLRSWGHGAQAGLSRLKAAWKVPQKLLYSGILGFASIITVAQNTGSCFSGVTPQASFPWELSVNPPLLLCWLTRKWHHPTSWVRRGSQNSSRGQVQNIIFMTGKISLPQISGGNFCYNQLHEHRFL